MVKMEVLKYLSEHRDEAISGEMLAGKLNITRNSVWKAVQNLRSEGFTIEAVTNAGYIYRSEGQALSQSAIMQYLPEELGLRITVEPTVGSTNTELKKQAELGAKEGTVLIAEEQTGGKGRLGRSFYSPGKTGLYMSVLLRPTFSPAESLYITVAAAVAVAKAIEETTGQETGIKWVNDIYLGSKKISGILTEASLDFESGSVNYAVLGIGINVAVPQGGFPPEIEESAGALYKENVPEGAKAKLAAAVLKQFMTIYRNLEDRSFMAEYQKRSILTDCLVTLTQGNQQAQGRVVGISDKAELVVRLHTGEIQKYSSGEAIIEKESLRQILKNYEQKASVPKQ